MGCNQSKLVTEEPKGEVTGKYGKCVICGKPADFTSKETKAAVCGKECKLVNLKNTQEALGATMPVVEQKVVASEPVIVEKKPEPVIEQQVPVSVIEHTLLNTQKDNTPKNVEWDCIDGNTATTLMAYAMSEVAYIYPITPSSGMGEMADEWAAKGKLNIFKRPLEVVEMQSEGGAAGAVHGALATGALTTTFTASNGLLLMIPNLYKIAGELMPAVFHVAARSVCGQALCIFGDHSDAMACRQTGLAQLASGSVLEAQDFALISHLASVKSYLPFMHFFDGFRVSHEVSKVPLIDMKDVAKLAEDPEFQEGIRRHRARALNPQHPTLRGTSQGPDVYFQYQEASNKYYDATPGIVEKVMRDFERVVGRGYNLFDYVGSSDAEYVVVSMGASTPIVSEAIRRFHEQGQKVGAIKVRLYRPWSAAAFMKVLPPTVKKIAVLDRTKESGSLGEPLYLDIVSTIMESQKPIIVVGGRYGLGSKDFNPTDVATVLDNLRQPVSKNHFTIGIVDDVTGSSLVASKVLVDTVPQGTRQCLFFGMGSDGTVGANKEAIKIVAKQTDLYAQAYFQYDAHKSGGVTISHLRFGPNPISSQYYVTSADYVACHFPYYVTRYDLTRGSKEGSIFLLNSPFSMAEMEKLFPNSLKRGIARKHLQFYNIDAATIANSVGLGKRINMIMQACFFKLAEVIPFEEAISYLKAAITKAYSKKGDNVVEANIRALDAGIENLVKIDYPASWADLEPEAPAMMKDTHHPFINDVLMPMLRLKGDDLPVSKFEPGGFMPSGTTKYEKRTIAIKIPVWIEDKCTQCNYCSFVCPHAAIRPFMLDNSTEYKDQPDTFTTVKAVGSDGKFRIQVSPMDCTGCELCFSACPDDALVMTPVHDVLKEESVNWNFALKLPQPKLEADFDKYSVKGSQFKQPLMEFNGACEGCGETAYVKLLTQLFGERMLIANATGCSSIWGGTVGINPYTTNPEGRGPAWGNSLFEDNAEYGLGMCTANLTRRRTLLLKVEEVLKDECKMSDELRMALNEFVKNSTEADVCTRLSDVIPFLLKKEMDDNPELMELYDMRDMIPKVSHWVFGGDGWAYDIGYGGLDHVLASGENINVLVMDTEVYSNTGGQKSKATPISAVAKFAFSGKTRHKKELGQMAMQYGDVYVASVALGSNMSQVVRAFKEAEAYDGPSLIVCLSSCIAHGNKNYKTIQRDAMAVDSGYWPLYRFNPTLKEKGENPFVLDSRKIKSDVLDFILTQNRFLSLAKNPKFEEHAANLHAELKDHILKRHESLKARARPLDYYESLQKLMSGVATNKLTILYGSETGNAEDLANELAGEAKRRDFQVTCMPLDDFEYEDSLAQETSVVFLCSTCGQGEYPANSRRFFAWLKQQDTPTMLSNMKYAVFALGDSAYTFFNKSGIDLDEGIAALGGQKLIDIGMGDDQDAEGKETKWEEFVPMLWKSLGAKEPPMDLTPPEANFDVIEIVDNVTPLPEVILPSDAMVLEMKENRRLTPEDYDRDIRHIEFDIKNKNIKYNIGDCLAIYPNNDSVAVEDFCNFYSLNSNDVISINPKPKVQRNARIPSLLNIKQLFTEILDIYGRPSRRFYRSLLRFATDKNEKEQLIKLVGSEGTDEYKELADECVDFVDILKKFPSAKPGLEHLIEMIPCIKPRYYSIASSMRMHPESIQLCIVLVDYETKSKKIKYGLTTKYLGQCQPGTLVKASLSGAAFTLPPSPENPLIFAGMGTGMAPFRAFVEDRAALKRAGTNIGPISLFFGCRYYAKDFLYKDELEAYVEEGVLTNLIPACSRDQEHKIYVQDRIRENAESVSDMLQNNEGFFYMCGPAKNVPQAVRAAVKDTIMTQSNLSEDLAEEIMVQLLNNGRYNIEAY